VLRDAYHNSSFDSEAEVLDWRESPAGEPPTTPAPDLARVSLPSPSRAAGRSLAATVMRRGSTRQFSGEPISGVQLSTALFHATRGWGGGVAPRVWGGVV